MRLGLPAEQAKAYVDKIPIGYAVTYIYGTIGSALVLAKLGPWLLGIDLPKACADYEKQMGAGGDGQNTMSARRNWEVRAYVLEPGMPVVGKTVAQAEASETRGRFLSSGSVAATKSLNGSLTWCCRPEMSSLLAGRRDLLVDLLSECAREVDDKALLDVPVEQADVYVTNKEISRRTLAELSTRPAAHGVFLRKITRNMVEIPILPNTEINRGDILTLIGTKSGIDAAAADLGYADRAVETTDIAFLGAGILVGGLVGALSFKWGSIPIGLSTSGGALLALDPILGWLRTIHPTFGRIPGPALALMNTLGLNVFHRRGRHYRARALWPA